VFQKRQISALKKKDAHRREIARVTRVQDPSLSSSLSRHTHTFFRGATLLANVQPRRQPRASSIFVDSDLHEKLAGQRTGRPRCSFRQWHSANAAALAAVRD